MTTAAVMPREEASEAQTEEDWSCQGKNRVLVSSVCGVLKLIQQNTKGKERTSLWKGSLRRSRSLSALLSLANTAPGPVDKKRSMTESQRQPFVGSEIHVHTVRSTLAGTTALVFSCTSWRRPRAEFKVGRNKVVGVDLFKPSQIFEM